MSIVSAFSSIGFHWAIIPNFD